MKIPDKAIDAATDVFPWQAADYLDTDAVRAALEAALPYILAPAIEVADRLEASTLSGDSYMSGRGSGFRLAGVQIKQALGVSE